MGASLLDPLTYKTLKKFPLAVEGREQQQVGGANILTCTMEAELDLDTLAVRVRSLEGSGQAIHLFRLVEVQDIEEEEEKHLGKRRKKSGGSDNSRKRRRRRE